MVYYSTQLYHHGVEGQKWGVRRYQNEDGSYKPGAEGRYYKKVRKYQNEDGSLTKKGQERYGVESMTKERAYKGLADVKTSRIIGKVYRGVGAVSGAIAGMSTGSIPVAIATAGVTWLARKGISTVAAHLMKTSKTDEQIYKDAIKDDKKDSDKDEKDNKIEKPKDNPKIESSTPKAESKSESVKNDNKTVKDARQEAVKQSEDNFKKSEEYMKKQLMERGGYSSSKADYMIKSLKKSYMSAIKKANIDYTDSGEVAVGYSKLSPYEQQVVTTVHEIWRQSR